MVGQMKRALLVSALLIFGCAQMQVSQRQKELDALMNPLLGKTKEDIVMALGAPREVQLAGGLEIYKYVWSYGTRSKAAAAPNPYLVTANARTWETYDAINAYFKDGVMVKWDGYVQR